MKKAENPPKDVLEKTENGEMENYADWPGCPESSFNNESEEVNKYKYQYC